MEFYGNFIKSIVGGFLIGIGGTCFLSVDDKLIGSLLFSVGLLAICTTNNLLFTGKASYTLEKRYLFTILLGNFIGASLLGGVIRFCLPRLHDKAIIICQNKMNEGLRIIPLGVLCNILIYFAIEGYKRRQTILLIMCVVAFIICGFEQCIANMYYFAVANIMTYKGVFYLLANIFSNLLGGFIVQIFNGLLKMVGCDEKQWW